MSNDDSHFITLQREAGVVILAAGMSERMKELKAFLYFDNNTRFIEKIISTYTGWGCREICVVANTEADKRIKESGTVPSSVKIVVNDHMEFERFYSVKLGLGAIHSSSFCFIQNVDNPFIDSQILDLIYGQRSNEKYVSPVFKGKGGHPVLLNRENMSKILNWPENSTNFKEVLKTMECRKAEMPDDRVLININSPEEYQRFFNLAGNGINL
jgi:molybdenum cofactor cytidylyltransferase